MPQLRIATRSSAQATAQARAVATALEAAHPGLQVTLVFVETLGDQRADVPLHTMGGQGVFVKEVQHAVLRGDADLAAHSAKDLPSMPADGLTIGAFCERRDPRDALIGASLADLAPGATVATGSVRRRAQLAPAGGAIVMAVAALQILELTDRIAEPLDLDGFIPSPGQGCEAVEYRTDDPVTARLLAAVDHVASRRAVELERAFLARLGTGCSLPVAAHADSGRLSGFLADPARGVRATRQVVLAGSHSAALQQAAALAEALQEQLDQR